MHDPQYRMQVTSENTAYNQPPHPGFHIGNGMVGAAGAEHQRAVGGRSAAQVVRSPLPSAGEARERADLREARLARDPRKALPSPPPDGVVARSSRRSSSPIPRTRTIPSRSPPTRTSRAPLSSCTRRCHSSPPAASACRRAGALRSSPPNFPRSAPRSNPARVTSSASPKPAPRSHRPQSPRPDRRGRPRRARELPAPDAQPAPFRRALPAPPHPAVGRRRPHRDRRARVPRPAGPARRIPDARGLARARRRDAPAPSPSFRQFFALGVRHILTGYDHLLFLFALLLACRGWRAVLGVITCFTVAHSNHAGARRARPGAPAGAAGRAADRRDDRRCRDRKSGAGHAGIAFRKACPSLTLPPADRGRGDRNLVATFSRSRLACCTALASRWRCVRSASAPAARQSCGRCWASTWGSRWAACGRGDRPARPLAAPARSGVRPSRRSRALGGDRRRRPGLAAAADQLTRSGRAPPPVKLQVTCNAGRATMRRPCSTPPVPVWRGSLAAPRCPRSHWLSR